MNCAGHGNGAAAGPRPRSSDGRQTDAPTLLSSVETVFPRKTRATIATIAMRTRMSAYSTRPWPCSLPHRLMRCRTRSMCGTPFGSETSGLIGWRSRGDVRTNERRAGFRPGALRSTVLDRRADLAQDRADLVAEEDQGNDRDDRDEGEDQRVLGETL